jgi:arabinofuranosyltransferase
MKGQKAVTTHTSPADVIRKSMKTLGKYKSLAIFVVVAALFLAHAYYLDALFFHNCYDDAYISFRYAKNLTEGKGLSFNNGDHVEGYTNLGWVLANATAHSLGTAPEKFSKIAGYCFGLLCLAILFLFQPSLQKNRLKATWWAPLMLATGAALPAAAVSGLETAAWLACILGALLLFYRFIESGRTAAAVGASIFLAAVVLLRADGFVIVMILFALAVLFHREHFTDRKQWLMLFGFPTVCIAALFLFRIFYFGQLLPNTYYAKVDIGVLNRITSGLQYLIALVVAYALYAALILIPARNKLGVLSTKICLPFAGFYALYLVSVGGDLPYLFRLALPILACLYIAMADSLFGPAQTERSSSGAWLFTTVFILLTVISSFFGGEDLRLHRLLAPVDRDQIALGKWLDGHVPADTTIAVQAAGQIPYYAKLKAFDLYGLTDPDVRNWPVIDGPQGHRRFNPVRIIGYGPRIIAANCSKVLAHTDFAADFIEVTPIALPGIRFCARKDYLEYIEGVKPVR